MKSDNEQQPPSLFNNALIILSLEDIEYPCELIDLSLQGCLLCFQDTWEQHNLEAIYALTLQLPDTSPIVMNLSVSHVVDNEVTFKCEHIDLDDVSMLRFYVELNSDDSALLDRELIALTHSR